MATKKDTSAVVDAAAIVATPENTPVPGGGSWRWDADQAGWVPNAPYAPPPVNVAPAPVAVANPVAASPDVAQSSNPQA